MVRSESAVGVDQPDPHLLGTMERSGKWTKPLKTHALWRSNRAGNDQEASAARPSLRGAERASGLAEVREAYVKGRGAAMGHARQRQGGVELRRATSCFSHLAREAPRAHILMEGDASLWPGPSTSPAASGQCFLVGL